MKLVLLLFVASVSAFAQSKTMVVNIPCNNLSSDTFMVEMQQVGQRWCDSNDGNNIKEWNGSTWAATVGTTPGQIDNFPMMISAWFVCSEIPNYPKVVQDGTARNTTVSVQKRCADGSVLHALLLVNFPTLTAAGSTLTFVDQATANDTSPTRDDLLNTYPNMDAKIIFTPDTNNCPSCTAKTVSLRTWLSSLPNNIPKCSASATQMPPCFEVAGPVGSLLKLEDHTTKTQDVGWKQSNAKTFAAPAITITSISGQAAFSAASTTCSSNSCTFSATGHLLQPGDLVSITGCAVANANGSNRYVDSVTSNTFVVTSSYDTSTKRKIALTLAGSGAGGTITPTAVTVAFSPGASSIRDNPFWPGQTVTIAGVVGSGISGSVTVHAVRSASSFHIIASPTGAYTSGGTATITRIPGSQPFLLVNNSTGITAPTFGRPQLSGTYTSTDRICSIGTYNSLGILRTGNDNCETFTINETSLTQDTFQVTVNNASTLIRKFNQGNGGDGWQFWQDKLWLLYDGTNPVEVVDINIVSGNTVSFSGSATAGRTLRAGTRSAKSGTIQLISFGRSRQYSDTARGTVFGPDFTLSTNPNYYPGTFTEISTTADEIYRTVRPVMHLLTIGTHQSVRLGMGIEDTQRYGDQVYSLQMNTGVTPVARYPVRTYEKAGFRVHTASSRFSRKYWISGSNPPIANVDHNISYLRRTGAVYYYNPNFLINSAGRDDEVNDYLNMPSAHKDLQGLGYFQAYMGFAGGRPELGPYTRGATRCIMAGLIADAWKVCWIADRQQDFLGMFPVHLREGSPDPALVATSPSDVGAQTYYMGRQNCTVLGDACDQLDVDRISGLGRIFSIRSHPKAEQKSVTEGNQTTNVTTVADRVPYRGGVSNFIQLTDTAHMFDHGSGLYAITGDPWIKDEIMFWASFTALQMSRSVADERGPDGGSYGCCGYGEHRALGRKNLTRVNVAYVLPDGRPEQRYFSQQVKENIVAESNMREISTAYDNEDGFRLLRDWSRTVRATKLYATDGSYQPPSPLGTFGNKNPLGAGDAVSTAAINASLAATYATNWEHNINLGSYGRAEQLGWTGASPLKAYLAKVPIMGLTSPNVNKYNLSGNYSPGSLKGWTSDAALLTDLASSTSNCPALTVNDFKVGGVLQKAGAWPQSDKVWNCMYSDLPSNTYNGTTPVSNDTGSSIGGGRRQNYWRDATLGTGSGCDPTHGYAFHIMDGVAYVTDQPGGLAAFTVANDEILNGSCINAAKANPMHALDAVPAASVPPPQLMSIQPNSWTPTCYAGSAATVPNTFSILVSRTPEVNYSVSDNVAWLSFNSGVTGTTPGAAAAVVDCSSLTAGTYSATITATAPGTVNGLATVSLTVLPAIVTSVSVRQIDALPTAVIFKVDRSSPIDGCSVTLNGQSPVTVDPGLASEIRWKTGLSANTTYATTTTCDSGASWSGNLVTSANLGAGTTVVNVSSTRPTFINITGMQVQYGTTSSASDGIATATCSASNTCKASFTANIGSLMFYKKVWTGPGFSMVGPLEVVGAK